MKKVLLVLAMIAASVCVTQVAVADEDPGTTTGTATESSPPAPEVGVENPPPVPQNETPATEEEPAADAPAATLKTKQSAVAAAPVDQVCDELSSGKINVGGTDKTLEIFAPDGFLIDFYCVKAGSAQQGDGPEIVQVDPPAASVVISHSSGKDISHYAAHYVKKTPPGGGDEPGDGDEPTGGVSPAAAEDDDLLPNTGGLPLWVLLLAGPMMAAGVVILKRRNGTASRGGMHL